MALTLNLEKAKPALTLSLEKAGIFKLPVIDWAAIMDVSGSFHDEHESGITSDVLTRFTPYGLLMDPDHKLDAFTFSNTAANAHYVGAITQDNYRDYVKNQIIWKVPGYGQFTDYSYVTELALKHFGWLPTETKKAGFLGRLMGKKDEAPKEKKRSAIAFLTDGASDDEQRMVEVLEGIKSRGDAVYITFFGIDSNPTKSFPFLERMARAYEFVGYHRVSDIQAFVSLSDEQLNDLVFDKEFTNWLKLTA